MGWRALALKKGDYAHRGCECRSDRALSHLACAAPRRLGLNAGFRWYIVPIFAATAADADRHRNLTQRHAAALLRLGLSFCKQAN